MENSKIDSLIQQIKQQTIELVEAGVLDFMTEEEVVVTATEMVTQQEVTRQEYTPLIASIDKESVSVYLDEDIVIELYPKEELYYDEED